MKKLLIFFSVFLAAHLPLYHFTTLPLLFAGSSEPPNVAHWTTNDDIQSALDNEEIDDKTFDRLKKLYDTKLNINMADTDLLVSLPGITITEASDLVDERLKNGPYAKPEDLVSRNVLDQLQYEKIKLFITAEKVEALKTRGKILAESIITPESKPKTGTNATSQTTQDLFGQAFSPTQDRFSIAVTNIGKYFMFGTSVLGDAYLKLKDAVVGSTLTVEEAREVRLQRVYAGYESDTGFLRQAFLGHYEANFGNALTLNTSNESDSTGLFAGDVTFKATGQPTQYLKGAGSRFKWQKWDQTVFYSKDLYRAKVNTIPIAIDSKTGALTQKAKAQTLDDMFEEEIIGTHADFALGKVTRLGGSWYKSNRKATPRGTANVIGYPPEKNFNVGGINFLTAFKGAEFKAEAAKVEGHGNGYDIDTSKNFGGTKLTFNFRLHEEDFFNPQASGGGLSQSGVAALDAWKFDSTIIQKIGKKLRVTLDYEQKVKKLKTKIDPDTGFITQTRTAPVVSRKIMYTLDWDVRPGVQMNFGQTFNQADTQEPSGTDVLVGTSPVDKNTLATTFGFDLKSGKTKNSFRLNFQTQNRQDTGKFKVGTKSPGISYELTYNLSSDFTLRGKLEYSDPDFNVPNNETQQFTLELADKVSKNLSFRLKWKNKFQGANATQVDETTGLETANENPLVNNTIELKLQYKW